MATKIVYWSIGDAPLNEGLLTAVIGNFDGVHLGHQKLISTAKSFAKKDSTATSVITFNPHPRRFFRKNEPSFLLSDLAEKNRILSLYGVEKIIHVSFNDALRELSPDEFVTKVLSPLGVSHLLAGKDFAFGRARAGDMTLLSKLGNQNNIKITSISLEVDDKSAIVSSSRVRAALQAGHIDEAIEMLGRPPTICGIIEHGDKRGRQLNFPTANFNLQDYQVPAYGVYAITAIVETQRQFSQDHSEILDGEELPMLMGVANIGIRPTIGDRKVMAEIHLFDFNEDIYGARLRVNLHHYLRGEKKFDSIDALKVQIEKDATAARALLVHENNDNNQIQTMRNSDVR